jgi:hypothetical protein
MCQQNKNITHPVHTPLYKIPTVLDAKPFEHIAMDLITGLPTSKGQDAILTIVDYGCSYGAIFLPCSTTITGPGITQWYLKHVYPWFGIPKHLISDHDPHFILHFSTALAKELGIQWNLSTAFHPQMDGLTERKNQWVEQYLHIVTANQPQDWETWLPLATAVHNNWRNTTLGFLPNEILKGVNSPLVPRITEGSTNEEAEKWVDIL